MSLNRKPIRSNLTATAFRPYRRCPGMAKNDRKMGRDDIHDFGEYW